MKKRIAILGFMLESNRFAPVTTDEDYRKRCYLQGKAITDELAKPAPRLPAEIGGFCGRMRELSPDADIIPIVVADAEPGGSIDQAFFERTLGAMDSRLSEAGPLDGVYICSHGAMRATADWDPDATLYAMVRGIIGPDVPMIATLDLHANVSQKMVDLADVLVAYRTNPHVDQRARAVEAASIMNEIWSGMRPHVAHIKIPLAAPTVTLLTKEGPYADLINYGQTKVGGDILNVSITAGFIYSDSPKCGMSVIVTSRNGARAGMALARDIAARAWGEHTRYQKGLTALARAVGIAVAAGRDSSLHPHIMADVADNPGGGGSGATTFIIKAFLDASVSSAFIGLISAPDIAAKAHAVGVGGRFEASFNTIPKTAFDKPLSANVTVEAVTDGVLVGRRGYMQGRAIDLGPCALLAIGGVKVGVASHRKQCADPAMIEQFGLDIRDFQTVVVKSRGHFRAGFDEFFPPERTLEIDCPGLTSPQLQNFDWRELPRPVYPLDQETSWSVPSY